MRLPWLVAAVGASLQSPAPGRVRRVEPSRTALVLVEFQNDFVSAGGKFHDVVKDEIARTGMLRHTAELLARARRADVPVIHVPYTYSKHYRSQSERVGVLSTIGGAEKIASGAWREPAFFPGSWGAAFAAATAPASGEFVVRGKHGLDAFAPPSDLDEALAARGVTAVILAGFLTNVCVESTARSAYERGYAVVVASDCTAALDQDARDASLRNLPLFATLASSDNIEFAPPTGDGDALCGTNLIRHVRTRETIKAITRQVVTKSIPSHVVNSMSFLSFLQRKRFTTDRPFARLAARGLLAAAGGVLISQVAISVALGNEARAGKGRSRNAEPPAPARPVLLAKRCDACSLAAGVVQLATLIYMVSSAITSGAAVDGALLTKLAVSAGTVWQTLRPLSFLARRVQSDGVRAK